MRETSKRTTIRGSGAYAPCYRMLGMSSAKPGAMEIEETPAGDPDAEGFYWYGWRVRNGPYVRIYPADRRTFEYWNKRGRKPRKIYFITDKV